MKSTAKKTGVALLAIVFALTMMAPAISFAQPETQPTMTGMVAGAEQQAYDVAAEEITVTEGAVEEAVDAGAAVEVPDAASEGATATDPTATDPTIDDAASSAAAPSNGTVEDATTVETVDEVTNAPVGDCTVTIQYLEYTDNFEPDDVVDEGGRVFLGTRTITGLHEGDMVNAWDYVVNIPGHFFFDGWPLNLTVSADPTQNIIKLIYMKLHNSEYTVNYYLMTGADLTADNWGDALGTGEVEFTKMGSQRFDNQEFDSLIEGDAYEYQLNDLYVIDTYPNEIRLDVEPDNNVINVLYTTAVDTGPVGTPMPDDPDTDEGTGPDDGAGGDGSVQPPDNTTMDKDEITGILPDDDEVISDFIGSGTDQVTITDEMLQHPVDKEQALQTVKAYQTGMQQAAGLSQTGDAVPWLIAALVAVVIGAGIVIVSLMRRQPQPIPIEEDSQGRES